MSFELAKCQHSHAQHNDVSVSDRWRSQRIIVELKTSQPRVNRSHPQVKKQCIPHVSAARRVHTNLPLWSYRTITIHHVQCLTLGTEKKCLGAGLYICYVLTFNVVLERAFHLWRRCAAKQWAVRVRKPRPLRLLHADCISPAHHSLLC